MQQLLENFRKYLLKEERSLQLQNALHNKKFFEEFYDFKKYLELLKQIPPLLDNKIVERLGSGMFGVAFKMDNNHIIKIFRFYTDDDKRYSTYMERLYSGKGSAQDFPIFDYETVLGVPSVDAYVEMAELIPLENFLVQTGRLIETEVTRLWSAYNGLMWEMEGSGEWSTFFDFQEATIDDIKNKIRTFQQKKQDFIEEGIKEEELGYYDAKIDELSPKAGLVGFTKEEFEGIRIAISHYKDVVGDINDLHLGNIGVFPHDPSKFIIFDN